MDPITAFLVWNSLYGTYPAALFAGYRAMSLATTEAYLHQLALSGYR